MALDDRDVERLTKAFKNALNESNRFMPSDKKDKGHLGATGKTADSLQGQKKLEREIKLTAKTIQNLRQQYESLSDDQKKEKARLQSALKLADKHLRANEKQLKAMEKSSKVGAAIAQAERDRVEAIQDSRDAFKQHTKTVFSSIFSVATLTKGLIQLNSDVRKAMSTGFLAGKDTADVTSAFLKVPAQLGISMKEFLDIQKEFRYTATRLGEGTGGFIDSIAETRDELFHRIGDSVEATRLATTLHDTAFSVGLSGDSLQQHVQQSSNSFLRLNKMIGMTASEFADMARTIAEDVDMQMISLRLDKKQRAAMQENTRQLVEHFLSLKYSREEATQLAMQMQKMQAEKPVDRIKRSMRAGAFAGAMGMSGADAQELTRLSMKRPEELSEGDLKRRRALEAQASARSQQMKTMGLGGEIAATALEDKLATPEMLKAGLDLLREQLVKEEATNASGLENVAATITSGIDKVISWMGGSLVAIAAGSLGALWTLNKQVSYLTGKSMFGALTDMLKGGKDKVVRAGSAVGGGLKNAAKTAAQVGGRGLMAGMGGMSGLMGKAAMLGPIGLKIAAVAAVAYGAYKVGEMVYENWDSIKEGMKNAYNVVTNFFGDMKDMVVGWFGGIIDNAKAGFIWIKDAITGYIETRVTAISDWISSMWNNIKTFNISGIIKDLLIAVTPSPLHPLIDKLMGDPSMQQSNTVEPSGTTQTPTAPTVADQPAGKLSLTDEIVQKQIDVLTEIASYSRQSLEVQQQLLEATGQTVKNTKRRSRMSESSIPAS